jgi:uncharacterized protein YodC (DUF2158 family)
MSIAIGDRVRLLGKPGAPAMTVRTLYLEGETPYASCRWHKTAQEVAYPVTALEIDGPPEREHSR